MSWDLKPYDVRARELAGDESSLELQRETLQFEPFLPSLVMFDLITPFVPCDAAEMVRNIISNDSSDRSYTVSCICRVKAISKFQVLILTKEPSLPPTRLRSQ